MSTGSSDEPARQHPPQAPDDTGEPPPSEVLDAVRDVLKAVEPTDVQEFTVEREGFRVRVRRSVRRERHASSPTGADVSSVNPDLQAVVAPLTGIFYRAPSPTAAPYIREGDWVEASTVVGLVETMKVFNEVTADTVGRVSEIVATTGLLVHSGDTLLYVAPASREST